MRYQDTGFNLSEIAENIRRCDSLITELEKLDDDKKSALIDALTLSRITALYQNAGHSFSSDDALRRSQDESKRNLIKLIDLFPKDRRVALIASALISENTLVSHDPHHDIFSRFYQRSAEVYLKDLTEKVFFEDGYYNNVVNMSDFVWTWESFVKSLALYVKGKSDEQIEGALHDVLVFMPEDSTEQFFKEIGAQTLLGLSSLDSLLVKYKVCETLILNEINRCITKLEDVPKILRKIAPNSLKKFYDKVSKKIPGLANDINAFAYVLACFPERQSAALINAAPMSMGVDTLINDHNKLIQVVFHLNPKLRLAFLKNVGVIDRLKTGITPEKQALKNVLRQLLPISDQRFELDRLTRYGSPQAATSDVHTRVLGSANSEFEASLSSKGLDAKKPDDWKKNAGLCRDRISGLLRDCFLRPTWESDREFCQRIHHSSVNKLTLLAETGRYPEAELAMLIVSLAANKPVEAAHWLEKFKAWNTWFAWSEYKNNRWVMKGLTVICQEFHERLDFKFNCPMWITDNKQNDVFRSFVDTVKTILSNMHEVDKQRVVDYFKSPAFNCLADEDRVKYKGAVIVQIPLAIPAGYLGEEKLPSTPREEPPRPTLVGGRAHFFNAHSQQNQDMRAIVAGLRVPNNPLPVIGKVVEKEEAPILRKQLLI